MNIEHGLSGQKFIRKKDYINLEIMISLRNIFGLHKKPNTEVIIEKWVDKAYKWYRAKYHEHYEPKPQLITVSKTNLGIDPSFEEIERAKKIKKSWDTFSSLQKMQVEELARQNIPLGSECLICHTTERLCRHHQNYSKPLEIVTLCYSHHNFIHRNGDGIWTINGFSFTSIRLIVEIERKLSEQKL